jgi:hypothetical protein
MRPFAMATAGGYRVPQPLELSRPCGVQATFSRRLALPLPHQLWCWWFGSKRSERYAVCNLFEPLRRAAGSVC